MFISLSFFVVLIAIIFFALISLNRYSINTKKQVPTFDCTKTMYDSITTDMVSAEYNAAAKLGYTHCFC